MSIHLCFASEEHGKMVINPAKFQNIEEGNIHFEGMPFTLKTSEYLGALNDVDAIHWFMGKGKPDPKRNKFFKEEPNIEKKYKELDVHEMNELFEEGIPLDNKKYPKDENAFAYPGAVARLPTRLPKCFESGEALLRKFLWGDQSEEVETAK